MLHSRAGYRSARPILFITHIRLATHGRSIQSAKPGSGRCSRAQTVAGQAPQGERVEALGEPAVDKSKQFVSLPHLTCLPERCVRTITEERHQWRLVRSLLCAAYCPTAKVRSFRNELVLRRC